MSSRLTLAMLLLAAAVSHAHGGEPLNLLSPAARPVEVPGARVGQQEGLTWAQQRWWREVEADNGMPYRIDMTRIIRTADGGVVAYVLVGPGNFPELTALTFDCRGNFGIVGPDGSLRYAPPRSVAGRIGEIACAAKDTRTPLVDDSDKPELHLSGTTPGEYCRGFASDACSRITAMVNGQAPIPPCKPGFARVGSGYTPEQIRACQVKWTIRDAQTPKLVVASTTPLQSANPSETVIGQWSGEGNGKSNQFHIARGPWRLLGKTAEDDVSVSVDVYRVADHTLVTSVAGTPALEVPFWGDFYFVIRTAGSWTVIIVSPSSAAQK